METLVQDRIELAPELQKETANSSKVSVIILRTKNNAYVGFERPWEIKLLGKSMEEWGICIQHHCILRTSYIIFCDF